MSSPQSPLARLWTHVTSALSRLRASILPLHVLVARERRDLRASLRALEAFCRRLAITEALKLGAASRAIRKPTNAATRKPKHKRLPALRL